VGATKGRGVEGTHLTQLPLPTWLPTATPPQRRRRGGGGDKGVFAHPAPRSDPQQRRLIHPAPHGPLPVPCFTYGRDLNDGGRGGVRWDALEPPCAKLTPRPGLSAALAVTARVRGGCCPTECPAFLVREIADTSRPGCAPGPQAPQPPHRLFATGMTAPRQPPAARVGAIPPPPPTAAALAPRELDRSANGFTAAVIALNFSQRSRRDGGRRCGGPVG
jgi:hypothetical protein